VHLVRRMEVTTFEGGCNRGGMVGNLILDMGLEGLDVSDVLEEWCWGDVRVKLLGMLNLELLCRGGLTFNNFGRGPSLCLRRNSQSQSESENKEGNILGSQVHVARTCRYTSNVYMTLLKDLV
jgi:hypothetical protein